MQDERLNQARAIPIMEVAESLHFMGDLRRAGREWVGPCPRPGCGGTDRFSLAPDQELFNCRTCGGGDVIALVEKVLGLDFKAAVAHLVGEATVELTPEQEATRARDRADADRRRNDKAARLRESARAAAHTVWTAGRDPVDTPAHVYLTKRGFTADRLPQLPACLRFHPDLPYMVAEDGGWREVHRGPALLAAIVTPSGRFAGVHRTWFDPEDPRGKLRIEHAGKFLDRKKSLGSVKGNAIRLITPASFTTLIVGEGIETTLSPVVADPFPGAAYWSGVSLGNMAGKRILTAAALARAGLPPQDGIRAAGLPQMDDADAFVPPPWVTRLIFLQDGDSDAVETRAKLLSGLRRAAILSPGLTVQIVHAGDGVDMNDVLMEADLPEAVEA